MGNLVCPKICMNVSGLQATSDNMSSSNNANNNDPVRSLVGGFDWVLSFFGLNFCTSENLQSKYKFPSSGHFQDCYTLGEEIGKGAFAVVYKGKRKRQNQYVAVKVVSRVELKKADEDAIRLECDFLRTLEHPNVIRCFDFYEEPDRFYMILELVEGGELFDRIVKKTYYSEKEARDLVRILLSAIKHCHDHDIVHRDLKPENLLLVSKSNDEEIKLADFGLAARSANNDLDGYCGSPGYIAPEILEFKLHGKPVDMWSIGVITYVLLGGYLPFDVSNRVKCNRLVRTGMYTFHPEFWSNVSEEAKNLIRGLLVVDMHKRLTAEQALRHSWINRADAELAERNLEVGFSQLKKFNARRKFRAWATTIIAAAKFSRFGAARRDTIKANEARSTTPTTGGKY